MRVVLRQRNFALLWVGSLISRLGDAMLLIALPFYVYQRTGSTLAIGAMLVAETGPEVLLGSLAGVFVDCWDRRRTMIACSLLQAAMLVPLLTLRAHGSVWVVYLVSCAEASIGQFFIPAGGALLPLVVGDEQLLAANTLRAAAANLAFVAGPALGGAALALLGLRSVVIADAASFLLSGVAIMLIRVPATPPAAPTGGCEAAGTAASRGLAFWHEWTAGMRLARHDRTISTLFVLWGTTMLAQGLISVLWVPFVEGVLHGSAMLLGTIQTAQALGGIAGSFGVGYVTAHLPPRRRLAVGAAGTGLLLLAMVNVRAVPLILALSAAVGLPLLIFEAGMQTLLQMSVPDRWRGRILGAYAAVGAAAMLAGVGLGGLLGQHMGALPLLDAAFGLWILTGALALVLPRLG